MPETILLISRGTNRTTKSSLFLVALHGAVRSICHATQKKRSTECAILAEPVATSACRGLRKYLDPTRVRPITGGWGTSNVRPRSAVPLKANTYISVRFGNVLSPRGAPDDLSEPDRQWRTGLRLTTRGVTRHFMTIPEAVQLVVQAGAVGLANPVRCSSSTWASLRDLERNRLFDIAQRPQPIPDRKLGLRRRRVVYDNCYG